MRIRATELVAAVRARDTERVRAMLERNPDLVRTETEDGSLLLTAIYYGAREIANLIQTYRMDLDIFEAAVGTADEDPAQANRFNADGMTPLGLPAYFGHREDVEVLLDRGAAINALSRFTRSHVPRNTALHAALAGQNWEVAEALMDRGAAVNAVDSNGMTPLHVAAFGGNKEVVQ